MKQINLNSPEALSRDSGPKGLGNEVIPPLPYYELARQTCAAEAIDAKLCTIIAELQGLRFLGFRVSGLGFRV